MTVDDWPEWLPADWMIQIRKVDEKKVKCFIDPEGHKFYSKPQVDRHLKSLKNSTVSEKTNNEDAPTLDLSLELDVPNTNEDPVSTPQAQSTRPKRPGSTRKTYKEIEDGSSSPKSHGKKNEDSNWLPDDWTVEVKSKKSGQKYKIFIAPNGKKLFSKPQVLSYLGNANITPIRQKQGDKTPTQPEKSQISEAKNDESIQNTESIPPDYEVISSTPADGLPPGWIKEIRARQNGSAKKKDPYYIDPLSGYVFFSKLDALRYLDSGDIKKCAIKPIRRDGSQENQQIANLNDEEVAVASPPEPSKDPETPKAIQNGSSVTESKAEESGTETRIVRSITGDGHLPMPKSSKKDESWLPEGWVVEMKTRDNGNKLKCYKETATGKNFYSKPQVLTYLGQGSTTSSNSKKRKLKARKSYVEQDWSDGSGSEDVMPKKSQKTKTPIDISDYKETIVTSPAEGLPPGWIKEVRSRLCAGRERKDPFYIDPVTGYIFRSKLDALRYLETGDINLCAIRPRKRDENGNEVAITDGTPKPKPKKQIVEVGSDDVDKEVGNTENAPDSTTPGTGRVRRATRDRAAKPIPCPTPLSARASTRLKATKPPNKTDTSLDENAPQPDNGAVGEKEAVAGVNLEKQGGDEEQLDYQLEDDSSWTNQFDFAVKTLVGEFPPSEGGGVGNPSPAKAN